MKHLHVHTSQGCSGLLARESQMILLTVDNPVCAIGLSMPLSLHSYASNILPGVLRENLQRAFC